MEKEYVENLYFEAYERELDRCLVEEKVAMREAVGEARGYYSGYEDCINRVKQMLRDAHFEKNLNPDDYPA